MHAFLDQISNAFVADYFSLTFRLEMASDGDHVVCGPMPDIPQDPFWKLERTSIALKDEEISPTKVFEDLAVSQTAFPGMQLASIAAMESDFEAESEPKAVPFALDMEVVSSSIGTWCRVKIRFWRLHPRGYVIELQRRKGCSLCAMKLWEQLTTWLQRQTTGNDTEKDLSTFSSIVDPTEPDRYMGELMIDAVAMQPSEVALWLVSHGWMWIQEHATEHEIMVICATLFQAAGDSSVALPLMTWFIDGDLANTETRTEKKQLVCDIFSDAFSQGLLTEAAAAALPFHVACVRNIVQPCAPSVEPFATISDFELWPHSADILSRPMREQMSTQLSESFVIQ